METLVKINSQTAGRDKIARLLQYLSRVLWHRLQQNNKSSVHGIKNLEFQLSTFRKLLRFGRTVDSFYGILPLYNYPDATIRNTLILSKISNALFLLADHLLWLGRADLVNVNTKKWSDISNKYWLYSITMNLIRDFYEIKRIIQTNDKQILPQDGIKHIDDLIKIISELSILLHKHRHVAIDTVKNGCDFFIPLSALGHIKLSPGTVGWLGVISSVAGLWVLMDPSLKLSPA